MSGVCKNLSTPRWSWKASCSPCMTHGILYRAKLRRKSEDILKQRSSRSPFPETSPSLKRPATDAPSCSTMPHRRDPRLTSIWQRSFSTMEKKALGKGLGALLPERRPLHTSPAGETQELPLDQIMPNRYQPRREFADWELAELAESIAERPAPTHSRSTQRRWLL